VPVAPSAPGRWRAQRARRNQDGLETYVRAIETKNLALLQQVLPADVGRDQPDAGRQRDQAGHKVDLKVDEIT